MLFQNILKVILLIKQKDRAVLHTALRASKNAAIFVDGENVIPEVYDVKKKIKSFTDAVVVGIIKDLRVKQLQML